MSVKIRLRRMGRKKLAHYRIVATESSSPRDGRFIETLGYYKPMEHPARLILDLEKVDEWVAKGAIQSDTVRTLVNKARRGGDSSVALGEMDPEEASQVKAAALTEKRKKEAEAAAEAAAAEAAAAEAAAAEEAPAEEEAEEAPAEEEE